MEETFKHNLLKREFSKDECDYLMEMLNSSNSDDVFLAIEIINNQMKLTCFNEYQVELCVYIYEKLIIYLMNDQFHKFFNSEGFLTVLQNRVGKTK